MPKQTSPWRAGPISTFDAQREIERQSRAEASRTSLSGLTGDALDAAIMQTLFAGKTEKPEPSFIILAGQIGSGAGRSIPRLLQTHEGGAVPLSAEDLQVFHPRFLDLALQSSQDGKRELAEFAARWLQAALRHGREHQYSMLLEGAFASPDAALAVAHRFAESGYAVHVAAVDVRADESLLASTSTSLRQIRERQPPHIVSPREHAATLQGTRALIAASEVDPAVRRISVVRRDGRFAFDEQRSPDGDAVVGAAQAWDLAQTERMTALESAQWLGELRRITEFAQTLRPMPTPIRDALVDLHQKAVRRVVPELPVPAGSEVQRIQEQRHRETLADLTGQTDRRTGPDAAAPSAQPTPSTGALGR
ncbi:zeta toxin family protein [Microbacterium hydrocarbonoxydans]|uniref:zeta toxin family protein n=1 Tax=Microbacterium hydrocarbonoxydans TaxID=273678 RepID=UPI003D97159D